MEQEQVAVDNAGSDYLTLAEAATFLRKAPATVVSLCRSGRLLLGVHYFRPERSRPLFSRRALVEWIEGPRHVLPASRRRGSRLNQELLR